jgi:hypothetical protein
MTDWSLDKWLTKYKITTRTLLVTGLWMNVDAYQWAKSFAASSTLTWEGTVGTIVAVQGIAASFVVLVYKIYQENKTL